MKLKLATLLAVSLTLAGCTSATDSPQATPTEQVTTAAPSPTPTPDASTETPASSMDFETEVGPESTEYRLLNGKMRFSVPNSWPEAIIDYEGSLPIFILGSEDLASQILVNYTGPARIVLAGDTYIDNLSESFADEWEIQSRGERPLGDGVYPSYQLFNLAIGTVFIYLVEVDGSVYEFLVKGDDEESLNEALIYAETLEVM